MSKRSEIIYILQNLHFLLESGMPIVSCLDVLSKKSGNPRIEEIKQNLLGGKKFSEAFSKSYHKVSHVINMFIQIGESCGNLGVMLSKAIETEVQIKKINSSFLGALSYPLFICAVSLVMILLTMIGIVPKLLPMFRDMHVDLPIYTKFFIGFSNFIIHFGLYTIIFAIVLVSAFVFYFKKSKDFRRKIENSVLKMYGFRALYIRYHTSIIALCTSEYIRSGYSLHDALKIVAGSIRSYAYKEACLIIALDIQSGRDLSTSISAHEKLMPHWSYMLDLATKTGRLASQFERFYLENFMQIEETSTHIKRWSEPALMLIIGGIIALFAVSIISPIYSVVQHVGV